MKEKNNQEIKIEQEPEKKQSTWELIKETAVLLIIAYILALLFQTFLYQPFKVEQGSMTPTLLDGERIFVSKIGYQFSNPSRGDIVTLLSPKEPPIEKSSGLIGVGIIILSFILIISIIDVIRERSRKHLTELGTVVFIIALIVLLFKLGYIPLKEKRTLVKRIIGLPGETIRIRNGKTYINGKLIKEKYVVYPDYSDLGPYKIQKNNYFVMGDNRAGSHDSRDLSGIGPIPRKNILGKANIIYWPINKIRLLN